MTAVLARGILILELGLTLAACGYRIVDESKTFGPSVKHIEIWPYENASREAGFERLITDSLVEEFARRGVVMPLHGSSDQSGELIMKGEISDLTIQPSAFSSVALTVEDTIELTLDVSVRRAGQPEPVWSRNGWVWRERFLSNPDPQVYEANKEQTLRCLSAEIAGRIHDELFRQF